MVDKFRSDFFEKLIKEEIEKERALHLAQKKCFHTYEITGINGNKYQVACSKCGHSSFKNAYIR